MNIHKLDTRAVKSTQSADKLATSSAALRVRSDVKAGGARYPSPSYDI
jgi:hypothetical protein